MAALEDSSQGRTRDRHSLFERYQELTESTSDGQPTDVEKEDTGEESDWITAPFDPEHIDIETRTTTVDLLLSRLRTGMIHLAPGFQRHAGIWTDEQQSRLIESLLLRIPIPSFYAAEQADGSWAVVDGIQRLTSIARFFDGELVGARSLKLTGLEYLDHFTEAGLDDLSGRLQIRLRETQVVVHVIRQGTPEPVMFNIFARINTGGAPLTRQELRHALIPGRARTLLAELADSAEFRSATGDSVVGDRMADREMVLRYLAFRLTSPDSYHRFGDFDSFLAAAMHLINRLGFEEVNALRDEFAGSMRAAEAIFGVLAFRKYRSGQYRKSPINKALFETVTVNLARLDQDQREKLKARGTLEAFADLMQDAEFEQAISVATSNPKKVRKRFDAVRELFETLLSDGAVRP